MEGIFVGVSGGEEVRGGDEEAKRQVRVWLAELGWGKPETRSEHRDCVWD